MFIQKLLQYCLPLLRWFSGQNSYEEPYVISADHIGQVFDGIGAISGGGATSKLLYTLQTREREELFQYFFRETGGIQMLKVEMGGDDQTTDGVEASHMRNREDLSYARGYEWKLMRDARRVNPNLPICVLPWSFPAWLGNGTGDPFYDPLQTANYIIRWLEGARTAYSIEIECVGIWNERPWTDDYVMILRQQLNARGFAKVKIVIGDGFRMSDETYERMLRPGFEKYYDIIGVHYPGSVLPENIRQSGKTLWASEDFSTYNGDGGMPVGCMARTINRNYVTGNMTGMLAWHLISAFYSKFPYFGAELDRGPMEVIAATTNFVRRGWRFLKQGYGSGLLRSGGSYVTYTNGTDIVIVIETFDLQSSLCEYSNPKPYNVSREALFTIKLEGFSFKKLYSHSLGEIPVNEFGYASLTLRSNEIHTISSYFLKGEIESNKQKTPDLQQIRYSFPFTCYDNFTNDYVSGDEPRFLSPQKGYWEVHEGIAKQVLLDKPIAWCAGEINATIAVIPGYNISVDVRVPSDSLSNEVFVVLNTNCYGCNISKCEGIFIAFKADTNKGFVFQKLADTKPIAVFKMTEVMRRDVWYTVRPTLNEHFLTINFGQHDASRRILVDLPRNIASYPGFVGIGSTTFGKSDWDNLNACRL